MKNKVKYKKCEHDWQFVCSYWAKWCKKCGAINKNGKTKSPKFYLENSKED